MGGLYSGELALDGGVAGAGWWLVAEAGDGPGRVVAGPFADRVESDWVAGAHADGVRSVYGIRRSGGELARRPSPQDLAWLAHLGEQLDRLPEEWDGVLSEDDALGTLVVEVTAALTEAGLPLHEGAAAGGAAAGVCLVPEPELGGIVVSWRQHDRMSVEQLHGAAADAAVQQVMNRALADVLATRGFHVAPYAGAHVVLRAA